MGLRCISDESLESTGFHYTLSLTGGRKIEVTKNTDGTYSFVMPAAEAAVHPVFREILTGVDVSDQFRDVLRDAWYHDAVQWAVDKGVMNGIGADLFAPGESTTRAMVVTMLWRLEGEPDGKASPFTDVKAGSWNEQAVNWAAETGVVKGISDTGFAPDDPVTRQQLASILYRNAQADGQGFQGTWAFPLGFPDADQVSGYAYEPMCWMTMHGVINGMDDGTLAPKENADRAQIAAMFMRFCGEMEPVE